jgi:hypothetical protein
MIQNKAKTQTVKKKKNSWNEKENPDKIPNEI